MNVQQKMMLFINQPGIKQIFGTRQRVQQPRRQKIVRTIFPTKLELQRFKHLETARMINAEDRQLEQTLKILINSFHNTMKATEASQKVAQQEMHDVIQRNSAFYFEQDLQNSLQQLSQKIVRLNQTRQNIIHQKEDVEKMLTMTQIKKALAVQRKLLLQENEKLFFQQKKLDQMIVRNRMAKKKN